MELHIPKRSHVLNCSHRKELKPFAGRVWLFGFIASLRNDTTRRSFWALCLTSFRSNSNMTCGEDSRRGVNKMMPIDLELSIVEDPFIYSDKKTHILNGVNGEDAITFKLLNWNKNDQSINVNKLAVAFVVQQDNGVSEVVVDNWWVIKVVVDNSTAVLSWVAPRSLEEFEFLLNDSFLSPTKMTRSLVHNPNVESISSFLVWVAELRCLVLTRTAVVVLATPKDIGCLVVALL